MNLVERLRAVAAERLTKMDRAACYETEAADRITELEFNLAVTMRAYRMELEKVSEMAQQRNDLQSKLEAVSKEMASAKERMWETGHENERLQSRLATLSNALDHIWHVGEAGGSAEYMWETAKGVLQKASGVERQPHEYAHTCTIQQGPCAACSYLDRIGV
jgi:hypothetical protein